MAKAGSGLFAKKKARKEQKEALPVVGDYSILLSPVITEKSSLAGAESNCVVFRVNPRASKDDIARAVARIYKVEVEAVRTCNFQGKAKRTRNASGKRAKFKKAYVALKQGQTIDVVEGL